MLFLEAVIFNKENIKEVDIQNTKDKNESI